MVIHPPPDFSQRKSIISAREVLDEYRVGNPNPNPSMRMCMEVGYIWEHNDYFYIFLTEYKWVPIHPAPIIRAEGEEVLWCAGMVFKMRNVENVHGDR